MFCPSIDSPMLGYAPRVEMRDLSVIKRGGILAFKELLKPPSSRVETQRTRH